MTNDNLINFIIAALNFVQQKAAPLNATKTHLLVSS